jgi:hypothetical protein
MKIVGYDTKKAHTTEIVRSVLQPFDGQLLTTEHFLTNGLPDCDLIVISGILRGSGLVYKECMREGRDFLFIDHAYFLKGYDHPNWMRITKNRHAFGPTLVGRPDDRFNQHFKGKYALSPWRGSADGPILVLPPTNAISWLFGAHTWEDHVLRDIRRYTDHPIKVREKPEDPIVDANGNLTRMQINPSKDVPLSEDIKNARAVVVYNSNSAIECVKMGVPVICYENCAAYPISFSISDLENCAAFADEPDRQQLFNDLAYAQFTRDEMKQGLPLKFLDS